MIGKSGGSGISALASGSGMAPSGASGCSPSPREHSYMAEDQASQWCFEREAY
jgi:hypothetical protein